MVLATANLVSWFKKKKKKSKIKIKKESMSGHKKISMWEIETAYGGYYFIVGTYSCRKSPRNTIIWFRSEVYWTTVADMILCDL